MFERRLKEPCLFSLEKSNIMGNLGKAFHYLDRDCGKDRFLSGVHRVKARVCPYSSCNRENSSWVEGKKSSPGEGCSTKTDARRGYGYLYPWRFSQHNWTRDRNLTEL